MLYDLAIIGGGPAATAAGVYASRKRLSTVFITESFNGQSVVSEKIENWIGTIALSGSDLAQSLEKHLRAYAGDVVVIRLGERAQTVTKSDMGHFLITTTQSHNPSSVFSYEAKTVLIATGSARRTLKAIGADIFEHKGLTYCATCDGPLFADQDVAVIGGGNAGFESAAQLAAYCKSVTIIHKNNEFKADPVTVTKVLARPNVKSILNADIVEIKGNTFVTGLVYKDKLSNDEKLLPVTGIFVEIGATPATDLVSTLVERNDFGAIKVDPKTQKTSYSGIWAAGDCTDALYHQNNIAVGDGIKALEDIYMHLHA